MKKRGSCHTFQIPLMVGLNCMRHTSAEFLWGLKHIWKTITCYSLSLLLSNITLTLLVLQGTPDWLNSINYSCVIKNLYQNNNFVSIFMIFFKFSWYHRNNLTKINRKCHMKNNLWSKSKVLQVFMSLVFFLIDITFILWRVLAVLKVYNSWGMSTH